MLNLQKITRRKRRRQQSVVTTVARVDIGQERANLRTRVKNVSNVILSDMNLRCLDKSSSNNTQVTTNVLLNSVSISRIYKE